MGFLDKMRVGTPATATDPVCHMKVDPSKAAGGFSEHGGATYHFCSPGCKKKFDADPARYVSGKGGGAHEMGH